MYSAQGLLRPDSDFDLNVAANRIAAKLPGHRVTRAGDQITVSQGEWWIAVALTSWPGIQLEIEGLVGKLAGLEPAEAAAYVASGKRVEVWTDIPDSFMEHFNDYLSIVEVLKSFHGLLAIDPKEPGIL